MPAAVETSTGHSGLKCSCVLCLNDRNEGSMRAEACVTGRPAPRGRLENGLLHEAPESEIENRHPPNQRTSEAGFEKIKDEKKTNLLKVR